MMWPRRGGEHLGGGAEPKFVRREPLPEGPSGGRVEGRALSARSVSGPMNNKLPALPGHHQDKTKHLNEGE